MVPGTVMLTLSIMMTSLSTRFYQYILAQGILVGAGIGVTPFASILKHIWYRQRRGNLGALRRVEFFWICRDAPSFGWFQSLLSEVEAAQMDREYSM